MHCYAIRVQLHHFHQEDPATGQTKLKGNDILKNLYKKRVFRWKTLKNEMSTGQRIEVLEGLNVTFKEQLNPASAFIYRRGLTKEDICKDTLNFES